MYFACRLDGRLQPNIKADELEYSAPEKAIHQQLNHYLAPDKVLDGDAIMKDCFPTISDVSFFISHSHKDKEIAIQLANMLNHYLGLNSFIDSMVWEYADKLLYNIDEHYSLFDGTGAKFDYNKRNLSTSYVHMMLAHSLTQMMDKCDCIIFINTPNSIVPSDIENSKTTFSPWIFYELSMIQFLRIKKSGIALENVSLRKFAAAAHPQMRLPVEIKELPILKYEHLTTAARNIKLSDTMNDIAKRKVVMNELKSLISSAD